MSGWGLRLSLLLQDGWPVADAERRPLGVHVGRLREARLGVPLGATAPETTGSTRRRPPA